MAGEGSTFFLSPQGDTGGNRRRAASYIPSRIFVKKNPFGVWLGDPKGIQK